MQKYKTGYTTDVYEMFHIGHLNLLKRARQQCERLIVGVSTDELAEAYKQKHPVIPFRERIAIVESIKYVDEAVPQTSMDKMEAWNRLHFDVLFHGTDWKDSVMYQKIRKDFENTGVDVVFLEYTKGVSSTLLADVLHKIQGGEI